MQFAPVETRHEQVRRAEKLHDEIEPDANYPFDYLKYRITRYRDDQSSDIVIVGEAVLPDLRLLIDKVTASAPLPVGDDEPADTIEDLAARMKVSTKTIHRWRQRGLRWRWAQRSQKDQPCILIMRDAVECFQQQSQGRVQQAAGFSRIDQATRDQLIQQARQCLQTESITAHQLAVRLAPQSGRAVESIRQLLDDHDRRHPDQPLFPNRGHPLTPQQKHEIAVEFQAGVPASELAQRYGKTLSTVRRAINERRADRIRKLKIEWVASPTFARKDADQVLLRSEPMEALIRSLKDSDAPAANVSDLPPALHPLFTQPELDAEHQRSLVVRMNYLKFRAARNRDALDRYAPRVRELNQIEDDLEQARYIRDQLIACNLATVLSVGRRHLIGLTQDVRNTAALLTILEIGVQVLVEESDRYDPRRNRTLARHVTWATMSELAHREPDILDAARAASDSGKAKARSRTNVRINRNADEVLSRMHRIAQAHHVNLPGGEEPQRL